MGVLMAGSQRWALLIGRRHFQKQEGDSRKEEGASKEEEADLDAGKEKAAGIDGGKEEAGRSRRRRRRA